MGRMSLTMGIALMMADIVSDDGRVASAGR